MAFTAFALVAAASNAPHSRAQSQKFDTGPAKAIDGSHVEILGKHFKLYGIDTPDTDETCEAANKEPYPCGLEARQALEKLVKGSEVQCHTRGPNELNEELAVCSIGNTDLARAMIDGGWAIADRARTLYYEKAEEAARTAKRGIWQGRFILPNEWRTGVRTFKGQKGRFDYLTP